MRFAEISTWTASGSTGRGDRVVHASSLVIVTSGGVVGKWKRRRKSPPAAEYWARGAVGWQREKEEEPPAGREVLPWSVLVPENPLVELAGWVTDWGGGEGGAGLPRMERGFQARPGPGGSAEGEGAGPREEDCESHPEPAAPAESARPGGVRLILPYSQIPSTQVFSSIRPEGSPGSRSDHPSAPSVRQREQTTRGRQGVHARLKASSEISV